MHRTANSNCSCRVMQTCCLVWLFALLRLASPRGASGLRKYYLRMAWDGHAECCRCVWCGRSLGLKHPDVTSQGTSLPINKRFKLLNKTPSTATLKLLNSQLAAGARKERRRTSTRYEAMPSAAETWTRSQLFGATTSLFAAFVPTPRVCRGASLRTFNCFGRIRTRTRRRRRHHAADTPTAASAVAKISAGGSIRTGGGGDSGSSGRAVGRAERADSGVGAKAGLPYNGRNLPKRQGSRRSRPSTGRFIDAVRPWISHVTCHML